MRIFATMKTNRSNTWRVALAVTLLLALTLFPHHHHEGGAVCWLVEVCHHDGRANDAHTAHHHNDVDAHGCYWKKSTFQHPNIGNGFDYLPTDFWQSQLTYIAAAANATTYLHEQAAMLVCRHGKHCPRRGPPVMSA